MSKKIKFGILCNSLVFEAWEAACIEHLIASRQIELKLLVIKQTNIEIAPTFIQKLIKYPYSNLFYRVYKRYVLKANTYKQISFETKFKNIPKLCCQTIKKGKFIEHFKDEDVAHIKKLELDFMLRFGFNIIGGEILKSCIYGIWSFHHADNDFIRGGPIGFWEIYLKRNTCAAVLQQLNEHLDRGKILRKGYLKTASHSYAENIDQLTEMAAIWPLQVCNDLLNDIDIITAAPEVNKKANLYKFPTNLKFIKFLYVIIKNRVKFHLMQLLKAESWQIAEVNSNIFELKKLGGQNITFISKSNSEHYCADPFLWPKASETKVLFEYFSYKENIGKIAMSDGNNNEFKFLDFAQKVHMSYPFLFEYNDQVFCLPEQADAGKVTLYKMDENGIVTKYNDLILNFSARDASLVFYNQKWWLFCTKANYFENAALFIFYANSLHETFLPHHNNPVKVDVQNARPAGHFFVENDLLYRPAQNSAKHYGHKVNINKILKLNEFVFEEEIIETIDPKVFGNFIGIHHVVNQNGQTVIDLKQNRFSFFNLKHQLQRKLGKFF
jgi:hypothetical protein